MDRALLCAAIALAPVLGAQDGAVEQNAVCNECHTGTENTMEFACGTEVAIVFDKRHMLESAHGSLSCLACHVGLDPEEHAFADRGDYVDYRRKGAERCAACHTGTAADVDPSQLPERRIHGSLHAAGLDGAPLCTDCHAPHAVARGTAVATRAAQGCAKCHDEVYATFAGSVHGAALGEPGNPDLPTCTGCHAGHDEPGRLAAQHSVGLGQPCMNCHGDAAKMAPYGLSTRVVSTYLNDFHGVSVRFYGEAGDRAALPTLVCANCHGVHDVAAMSKVPPEQMKAKLRGVCRDCHAEAADTFPDAWLSHYEPSPTKAPLVFAVRLGYWIFIPFVILGLSLQIFAHVVLFQRRRRKKGQAVVEHAAADTGRYVRRFNRRHRFEHLLVMITFVLLVLTGLPQKFAGASWATVVTAMFGGIDLMRAIHRIVGILFSGLFVLHLVIAVGGVLAGRTKMSMVPTRKDFHDARDNLRYYLGTRDTPPQFDRYDYRQKFEYWGMIVGSFVMVASGFVLYFPMLAAELLPGQFIPAAKAAHTYEAMMALLTIVVWHMYGAHLNPDCYPIDRSIFTGTISVARMKHEHALEWARDKDKLAIGAAATGRTAADDEEAAPQPS